MPDTIKEITPRNASVFALFSQGLNGQQVADQLGITRQAVCVHVNKVLAAIRGKDPDSPIVNQRKRLTAILPDTGAVYEKIVKRVANTDRYSDKDAELALKASDTINKGLQVLITKTEAPAPTTYEHKRIQVIERLNIASQFGGHVPAAIQAQAEIMPEPTPPMPEADQTVENDDNTHS